MSSNWLKILLASFLTLVLMFPYVGSFLHMFEDHLHETCEISETHFHGVELDCDILDYNFATSIQLSHEIDYLTFVSYPKEKISSFYSGNSFLIDTVDNLRGPPCA